VDVVLLAEERVEDAKFNLKCGGRQRQPRHPICKKQ
jgi:hypothetical protein